MTTSRSIAIAVLLCSGFAIGQQAWYGAPVFVRNAANVACFAEPVASGLPLPAGNEVFEPNVDFQLVDSNGAPVPVQFKVLSRWGGERNDPWKPTKWMLVEFLANAPADSWAVYFLRRGPRMSGQVTHQVLPGQVRVQTGVAEFVIDSQNFNFLSDVLVGNVSVTGGPGALGIHDVFGALLDTTLTQTVVEEAGSVRTTVRQRGSITSLGLDFTVRYFFWSGRSDVKVDFRLENHGSNAELPYLGSTIDHAYFEDLSLSLVVPDAQADVATSTGFQTVTGGAWSQQQDWNLPGNTLQMLDGFELRTITGGTTTTVPGRSDGAIALSGVGGSVAVTVDRWWENFPKAFSVGPGTLNIELFPAFGNGPEYRGQYGSPSGAGTLDPLTVDFYRFEAGRWKTQSMTMHFRGSGGFTPSELAAFAARQEKPLAAMWMPDWMSRSFAHGTLMSHRRNWTKVSNQRYEQMLDVLARDDAADNQPVLGQIGFPGFRNRGGTYGGDLMYGWENFGDVSWGDGYSSLHYDLPWGVLINWHRTADYSFFDVGRDLIAHRRDYDQNHIKSPNAQRRGGQAYEKGWYHGNYSPPAPSHTWVHGLLAWYVMTGDEGAYESAIEVGEFVFRQHPETWDGWWGSRIPGWQIECLLNLHLYLGSPQYLSVAQAAMANYEAKEQASGGMGYVLNPGYASNPHAQTWMHCIMFNTLGKYHLAYGDPSVLPLMSRMATWIYNDVIKTYPSGPLTARVPAKVWGRYAPGWYSDPSTHHQWVTLESLSYAALCLHDNNYMAAARDMWESVTRYHQKSGGDESPENYLDSNGFSPIAFRMMGFPNSESKINSNIALWGQVFMAADVIWDMTW